MTNFKGQEETKVLDAHIELALNLAENAGAIGEVPVGALVIRGSEVIGKGANAKETAQCATGHAEIQAITEASKKVRSWRLNDCVLFTTLEPCPMCLAVCQQARIKKVYYGAKDVKGGAVSLGINLFNDNRLNHQFEVELIEIDRCGTIVSDFFKKLRKC